MEMERLADALLADTGLSLLVGAPGLKRAIRFPEALPAGLTPTGLAGSPGPGRVLLLGRTGVEYLAASAPAARERAVEALVGLEPPGLIVTDGVTPPPELVAASEARAVPLFVTGRALADVAAAVRDALAGEPAAARSIHGVLLDVYGVGVLLQGPSGIGKSEAGIELVMRGHRLVADDVVDLAVHPPSTVLGSGNEILRHCMEIRGLGIIDIRDLFGIASVRETKRIELVVRLEEWRPGAHFERLGLKESRFDLAGVSLPLVVIPVGPGRSLSMIVEIAARSRLLQWMGHGAAGDLEHRLAAGSRAESEAGGGEEDAE